MIPQPETVKAKIDEVETLIRKLHVLLELTEKLRDMSVSKPVTDTRTPDTSKTKGGRP